MNKLHITIAIAVASLPGCCRPTVCVGESPKIRIEHAPNTPQVCRISDIGAPPSKLLVTIDYTLREAHMPQYVYDEYNFYLAELTTRVNQLFNCVRAGGDIVEQYETLP